MRTLRQVIVMSALVAGCAAEETVVDVTESGVFESRVTDRGVETDVYDVSGEILLAHLVRHPDGMTHWTEIESAASSTQLTGIELGDLSAYNLDVGRAWERTLQVRQGTVGYGHCGSGWNQWLVPDGWWGDCCASHDRCYKQGQYERTGCDYGLAMCMASKAVPPPIIAAYFSAVLSLGGFYYSYECQSLYTQIKSRCSMGGMACGPADYQGMQLVGQYTQQCGPIPPGGF